MSIYLARHKTINSFSASQRILIGGYLAIAIYVPMVIECSYLASYMYRIVCMKRSIAIPETWGFCRLRNELGEMRSEHVYVCSLQLYVYVAS